MKIISKHSKTVSIEIPLLLSQGQCVLSPFRVFSKLISKL